MSKIQWKKRVHLFAIVGILISFLAMAPTSVYAASNVTYEKEFNGSNAKANSIALGRKTQGNFSGNKDIDTYTFTLSATSNIQLLFNGTGTAKEQLGTFQLTNSSGAVIVKTKNITNATSQTLVKQSLPKGKYYLQFKSTQHVKKAKPYHFTISKFASPPKKVAVKSISINAPTKTLTVGKSTTLKATFNPTNASNKSVTWKSSDTKIVTVDSHGKVTGKKAGKATITVTSKDGNKASKVTITINAAKPVGKTVYIAPKSGRKYHFDSHCRGLNNAKSISSTTESKAKNEGYTLCGWED